MSVEEFRNSCLGDRNEDFYRGSFNCAKGDLKNIEQNIRNPVFINGRYDKEKNAYGNKMVSQTFFIKGKYYLADLNTLRDLETECMIFESNENGEVTTLMLQEKAF